MVVVVLVVLLSIAVGVITFLAGVLADTKRSLAATKETLREARDERKRVLQDNADLKWRLETEKSIHRTVENVEVAKIVERLKLIAIELEGPPPSEPIWNSRFSTWK